MNIHLVGQGARRTDTFFLRGHADDHVIESRHEGSAIYAVEFADRRQISGGARQFDRSVIGVSEVKDRRQVAGHGAAPRRDIALKDSETLLDELNHRRVIEDLGIDVTSLAPGRDRDERHTLGEADRAVGYRGRDDFVFDADRRRPVSGCRRH